MTRPRVSVIVDTYNQERYIDQAIRSVLDQDYPAADTEIIVVDDGSTDSTQQILRQYETRVRVIRKLNGGQASAFNVAIAAVSGEIVAFLDGDDWWHKSKLSAVVKAFDENPEVAAVGHGYFEVPDQDPPTFVVVPYEPCKVDASSKQAAVLSNLAFTLLATSRLAVRRRVLDVIGAIPESFVFCADGPLISLSIALGGAVLLQKPLCYYRVHPGSLYTFSARDKAKLLRKADMLTLIAEYVRTRLKQLGVHDDIVEIMRETHQIEADRYRSSCGAISRRESAGIEFRDFRAKIGKASFPYLVFKGFVGALAYFIPGEQFNQMRHWYYRKDLKRWRSKLAPAEPLSPVQLVVSYPAQSVEAQRFTP
jgi:glycosyltransferase involved in cell wall biosynthesis